MSHQCSLCPFFGASVDSLTAHLIRRHKHDMHFIVHCSVCGASFGKINSFEKHFKRQHFKDSFHQVSGIIEEGHLSDAGYEFCDEGGSNSKKEEALYLLKLKAGHQLSDEAVNEVMLTTRELVNSKCKKLRLLLNQEEIANTAIVNEISTMEHVFEGLESHHRREQFFSKRNSVYQTCCSQVGY